MRLSYILRTYATSSSSNILHELKARGMVAQLTSQHLYHVIDKRKVTVYGGVDPSAASLHVGNLAMLITLLHFHLHGHNVIPLIGGATGRVGDPGGRTVERDLIAQDLVDTNAISIKKQVEQFFHRASQFARKRRTENPRTTGAPRHETAAALKENNAKIKLLNNLSWHSNLSLLSFLRFPGKLLRVNALLTRESVKARLGSSQGISYAEFSYQLLQAYDFYVLHRDYGVDLQVGGSDQWGNIVSGVELIRKSSNLEDGSDETSTWVPPTEPLGTSKEASDGSTIVETDGSEPDVVYGLTIPLLTTSTGEKFGKSAGNAVWLDEKMTSVFDFYQFFMRVPDTEVLNYLRSLTLLTLQEIEELYSRHLQAPERREAQRHLAAEMTEMIHGAEALNGVQLASSILFNSAGSRDKLVSLSGPNVDSLLQAIGDHPRRRQAPAEDLVGMPVTRAVAKFSLVPSYGKAKSLLQAGGLYLNNVRVESLERKLGRDDFMDGRVAILRAGREEHLILEMLGQPR